MNTMDHLLTEDLARALPGRRRPWEQAALTLAEPTQAEPATPEPVTGPPAPRSDLQEAEAAVMWATSVGEYQEAQARLHALLTGQRITAEPAPPPAPLPPTSKGWIVTKTLQRDGRGLIETVTERWEPS